MNYWLLKSEPNEYSIDNLKKDRVTPWSGIRNYQARNFMRDHMSVGDPILFYHSSCKIPGIVGFAEVHSRPYMDYTAWDKTSIYYDKKSQPHHTTWTMIDIIYVATLKKILSLSKLRNIPSLKEMLVLKKGQRLSIQPVSEMHFKLIKNIVNL